MQTLAVGKNKKKKSFASLKKEDFHYVHNENKITFMKVEIYFIINYINQYLP